MFARERQPTSRLHGRIASGFHVRVGTCVAQMQNQMQSGGLPYTYMRVHVDAVPERVTFFWHFSFRPTPYAETYTFVWTRHRSFAD